jgi:Heterokaryon incompatibility protein (HET)
MALPGVKYKTLTEPDSFRIILLQPSTIHDAPLQGSLVHSTLSQCDRDIIDHFSALSYVWGDATKLGSITIDDIAVGITATLEAALRDLRDGSRIMRVWADALCIDQSNSAEKAIQVGLMAEIYSTAHHTVIHLGAKTTEAGVVLSIAPSNTTGTVSNQYSWLQAETAGDEILKLPWFSRVVRMPFMKSIAT